jgi:hypothetical protein
LIYRPPSNSKENDTELINLFSDYLTKYVKKKIVLLGDLNLPGIEWHKNRYPIDKREIKFYDFIRSNCLNQLVKEPTMHKSTNINDLGPY